MSWQGLCFFSLELGDLCLPLGSVWFVKLILGLGLLQIKEERLYALKEKNLLVKVLAEFKKHAGTLVLHLSLIQPLY